MPLEAIPISATPIGLPSYLTVERADAIAAALHGVDAYLAATPEARARALPTASHRIDGSRRWQGRRAVATQALEFPRLDGDVPIDADPATSEPTVPLDVLIATVYEASSLLDGQRRQATAAAASGIKRERIGSSDVEYFEPRSSGGVPLLCEDADRLVQRYRLRTGRLL